MNKPKRKWWLRYSLRFSFVLITIFGVAFGVYSRYKKTRDDELAAIEKLAPSHYTFGYQMTGSRTPKEPPGPKWLRQLSGDDQFFARLKTLQLGDPSRQEFIAITDLDGVEALKELEQLSVYSSGIQDVSEIPKLQKLRTLLLDGVTKTCDLSSIGELPRLATFTFHSEEGTEFSLETFRDHPSLESLSVNHWQDTKLNGIEALFSIPNLKHLSFHRCEFDVGNSNQSDENRNQATSSEQTLPSLRSLSLQSNRGLESLGPLSSAPQLETIELRECRKLKLSSSDLDYPRLKKLDVRGCEAVKNLDGFGNSKKLETASITLCPLENIEGLRGNDRLKTLHLSDLPQLKSLEGIPTKSLETLTVQRCVQLSSVRPLADTANLTHLFLDLSPRVKKVLLHPQAKLESLHVNGDVDGTSLRQCLQGSKKTLTRCAIRNSRN